MRHRARCLLGAWLLASLCAAPAAASDDNKLLQAARLQEWDTVAALLIAGADPDTAQADGATALAWAAHWDHGDAAKALLDAGADPDAGNDYGMTPLLLAIRNRSDRMAKILLEGGADPNLAMWSGVTPLMAAARTGINHIVSEVLDHGADVNVKEPRRNQSALMWAISFGHPDTARLLIERGADIAARTKMLEDGRYTPIELEGYKANVSGTERGGYTPLMFAARAGETDTASLLLSRGAELDAVAAEDGSPLIIAAAMGHEQLALYLLMQGANPNIADANDMTALHYSMRDGLKLLHGYEIDFSPRVCGYASDSRCKSLEALTEQDHKLLEDPTSGLYVVEPKEDPNDALVGGNMYELADALLAAGADPDAKMKYPPPRLRMESLPYFNLTGATPFFLATASLDLDSMSTLLEYGVNPRPKTEINEAVFQQQTQRHSDDNQFLGDATALMVAVGMGRRNDFTPDEEELALEAARRLVNLGADVNAATATGWTPLHAAAFLGADKLVRFLVDHGARIDVENGCGQTPFSLTLGKDVTGLINRTVPHVSTAETLLELGAGDNPPVRVGECVLGRGGLEQDNFQAARVENEIRALEEKLKQRQQLRQ